MSAPRAAVYARTSKETDDSYSVASQVDSCLLYAERNGFMVPAQYVFREDYTGRALERPEYSKIRELARTHQIEAVIIYSTDRLARKVSIGEMFLDELIESGVRLHITSWNTLVRDIPEDRLRFNFEATFSGFERDKIVVRTRDGKVKKAKLSQVIGNTRPPYGYSLNPGKTGFVLNDYAPIARDVLLRYGFQQQKPTAIANNLEAEGIPTPGSLYYADRMAISDVKYAVGRLTEEQYQKRKANVERHKGQNRWTEVNIYNILKRADIYAGTYTFHVAGQTFSVAVPAIITDEEAEAVKDMLATGRHKFARKEHVKYECLMARRLTCAECEHSFTATHNAAGRCYYRCNAQRTRSGVPCGNRPVSTPVVDQITRQFVTELLLNPNRLFAWWQSQQEEVENENSSIDQDIEAIDRRIATTTAKLNRTLDRLTDRLDADELAFYTNQRDELKRVLADYRSERDTLTTHRTTQQVDPAIIEEFAQMGKDYRMTLETSTDFTFWRGLVDDLDITGVIGTADDGRHSIAFIVFGKQRKREYLPAKRSTKPNQRSFIEDRTQDYGS